YNNTALAYHFDGSFLRVNGGETLTLAPGVVIKISDGQAFIVDGTLIANGTLAQPIVLTHRRDDSVLGDTFNDGDTSASIEEWEAIYFNAGSGASTLENLMVRYAGDNDGAGSGGSVPALQISGAALAAAGLTIRDNQHDGIYIHSGGSLNLTGGLVLNNGSDGVQVGGGSTFIGDAIGFFANLVGVQIDSGGIATVSGSAFEENGTAVAHSGTNAANADFRNNWWGDANGPNDASAADGFVNVNPAGQNVSNFVQYDPWLTTRPALPIGPVVIGIAPSLANGTVTAIDVTFSERIDLATFTGIDLNIAGPQAPPVVDTIALLSGATYRVTFVTGLSAEGDYQIGVGPDITAEASGFKLDQDRDGIGAEAGDDVFNGLLTIDLTAPEIVAQVPSTPQEATVSFVDFTFSEIIDGSTFSVNDVTITAPGGGNVTPLSVQKLSGTQYRVGFAVQFVNGTYSIEVGAGIADLAGNLMTAAYVGAIVIDRKPLRIISQTNTGIINQPLESVEVTFSVPINPGTFTTADVQLRGDSGFVTVTGVTQVDLDGLVFRIDFERVTQEGDYVLIVGPAIADPAGILMNQDGDAIPGEIQDRFEGGFTLDAVGPYVTGQSVTGTIPGPVSSIDVTFSETILVASFDTGDVVFTGPSGAIAVTSITAVSPNVFRLGFAEQSASGTYQLEIGPFISDIGGSNMNQDGDDSDGELVDDVFVGVFTIDAVGPSLVGNTPSGVVNAPISSLVLDFDEAIDPASFGVDDVTATGPAGAITITSITQIDSDTFRLNFASRRTNGNYQFVIGPNLTDLAGNAMSASVTVNLEVALPNLEITASTVPTNANAGDTLDIDFTVENTGTATATGSWIDRAILSTNAVLGDGDDVIIGSATRSTALAPGGDYQLSFSYILPVLQNSGFYTVFLVADATGQVVEESEGDNSISSGLQIGSALFPDLQVEEVRGPPSGIAGSPVDVEFTVINEGDTSAAGSWTDRLYLSTDSTLSQNDVLLGSSIHSGGLAIGATYTTTVTVTLPALITGDYYVLVVTDAAESVVEGAAEGNNTGASTLFSVSLPPSPDLTVDSVSSQTLLIGDPVDITVTWTVSNQGAAAGTDVSWTDRVILSRDSIVGDGDDIVIGEFFHTGLLPPGSSYTAEEIILLPPALEGRFTLYVVTDIFDDVSELPDTESNVGSFATPVDVMRIPYADLVVDSVLPAATATGGQTLDLTYTVRNNGIGITDEAQWTDRVYLTENADGTGAFYELSRESHIGQIGPGEAYTRTASVEVPLGIGGDFYVWVRAGYTNGPFEFVYTDNNTTRATDPVNINFVPLPEYDLTVTNVQAPATALDSQLIDVSWTVRNDGIDSLPNGEFVWYDRVYLVNSTNANDRTLLGTFSRSIGLGAGNTYSRSELVRLPTLQGAYRIEVITDNYKNRVPESDEGNNSEVSDLLTISLAPRADLQVTSGNAPATVTAGTAIDVEFTVTNLGTAATPTGGSRWNDRVYFSFDNQLGGGDILLGEIQNGSALAIGQSYATTANFNLPQALAGTGFILFVADGNNRVDEFPQEGNNVFAVAIAIDAEPVPPPDLVITSVAAPSEAFDGAQITVRYSVENRGSGVTGRTSWTDQVWLTLGTDRPNPLRGDRRLGSFGHSGTLEVGEFYENQVTVTLPVNTAGQNFFITVWTDANDQVFEIATSSNVNPDAPNDLQGNNFKATPFRMFLTPPADLEVTNVTAPTSAEGLSEVTIEWTVQNNGAVATDRDRWADAIYLSTDDDLHDGQGKQWLVFAVPHAGALQLGESYTESATFLLPPSAEGTHFIVETNVDPRLAAPSEDLFLEQIRAIIQRAEQALGGPLGPETINNISNLSSRDIIDILVGGSEPTLE
ncbi:MAG: Ig-like domain-containing protein, partial [Verrucomicrobiae bacterium]|nr:Ig-like domain-containing protein [Verrucomicrobiae bacterium]